MKSILTLLLVAVFGEKLFFENRKLRTWNSQFKKNEIDGWNLLRTAGHDETVIFIFGLKQVGLSFFFHKITFLAIFSTKNVDTLTMIHKL